MQLAQVFAPTHLEGNVELAEESGLEIDRKCGGVMVNSEMMARTDVYVAGDTASYPDKILGRRRMQSYDHSYHSGALAAANMATNGRKIYNHLPVITSYGGPLGMDVVVLGDIDSTMETYSIVQTSGRFEPKNLVEGNAGSAGEDSGTGGVVDTTPAPWGLWEKGIVWFMKDRRVVGAMLLNLSDSADQVRHLISQRLTYQDRIQDSTGSQRILELEECIQLDLSMCLHPQPQSPIPNPHSRSPGLKACIWLHLRMFLRLLGLEVRSSVHRRPKMLCLKPKRRRLCVGCKGLTRACG